MGGASWSLCQRARKSWSSARMSFWHRHVAFDNRGAGGTDKPDSPYSIEMMAQDLYEALTAIDMSRVDIMGISMGGRIAIDLATRHPEIIDRLVLVSTCARVLRTWRRTFVFDVLHRLPLLRGRQPRYAFERQSEASASYDGTRALQQITAPTLILNGRRDTLAPLHLANELRSGIKESELRIFRGGHGFFMFGERKPFLEAVRQFLI